MAGEWREITLGEFVSLQRGHDLTDAERRRGTVPVIGAAGQNGFHDTPLARGPGIVVGRSGASFGQVHYCETDYWPHNTGLYVTNFFGNDPRFAFYFLKANDFSRYNSGSAQPSLNRNFIYPIEVQVPPLDEQRAIAHILGTLDDKIELNRRMNETLEAMARALFKSWFVDFAPVRAKAEGRDPGLPKPLADLFPARLVDSELGEIPEGWEVKVLDDLCEVVLGGDWGVDEPSPEHTERTRCIRGADIPDLQAGGMGKMPARYLKPSSLKKRRLADGDLVIEISGGSPMQSTGRPVLVSDRLHQRLDAPLVCSNFCRLLKPEKRACSKFVYLWLRNLYSADEFLQFENGTTGIKNLAFTLFSSRYKLCVPPDSVLAEFEAQVAPAFARQQSTAAEADSLGAVRDALLPKLISGEVRIKVGRELAKETTA
jgi:type I restriction enzyme S subunit